VMGAAPPRVCPRASGCAAPAAGRSSSVMHALHAATSCAAGSSTEAFPCTDRREPRRKLLPCRRAS
jgi:hypothetical protein